MLQSHNSDVRGPQATDWRWDAVAARDRGADGQFVYAVTSTGIFCRPSCPSRRPHRERVQFFTTPADARAAGFRACRRCRPEAAPGNPAIARAAAYLTAHADETVSLAALARVAGLSAFHLQRSFKRALGVTPREYQAACRAERFRRDLRGGSDVLTATYAAGYGSSSRLYDAAPTGNGMSPALYRRGGAGTEIGFVCVRSPLGPLLVAATSTGICAVKLGDTAAALEADLRRELPRADVAEGRLVQREWVRAIVAALRGDGLDRTLPLDIRGTAFQWRVWRALQAIPPGQTRTYAEVARAIGAPSSTRAVARACATNPVCLVIPCHRVVPRAGGPGGYRWGAARKSRLLERERKRSKIPPE